MILACPSCGTRYEVNAAAFPPDGRNVRCAKCGHVWHALPEEDVPPPFFTPPEAAEPVVFQQPVAPVRDPEPQVEEPEPVYEEEEPPAPPREPWYTKKAILMAGWASLVVVVLVIAYAATEYRREVVEVWPKSASLYSGLGFKVVPSGLKLGNVKSSEAPQNGRIVLTVTGALTNVTSRELPVPQIRVGLVDRDKRELYHWTVAPQVMTLKPGQSTRFVTRLSNPPEGAASYEVRFAKAGE